MKTYLCVLIMACGLMACTSDEAKVKEVALEVAHQRFEMQVHEDIAKGVAGKENLQKTAVKTIVEKAEYSVDKLEFKGADATVEVSVKTLPGDERQALIEIMAKLDPKKESNFNVSNALDLIRRQMQGEGREQVVQFKLVLRKQSDGWTVVGP